MSLSPKSVADAARSADADRVRLTEEQAGEIAALRGAGQESRRAMVPALEEILYEPLPVLDQGFIRVIDYMGDDAAIVQAARVSYGRGTKQVSNDRGLINYLMRHRHTSPFEMCEIKLHIKLPIFIARQWIRHRTANVNEYSARYSVLEDAFYTPAPEHLAAQSQTNRQGRAEVIEGAEASDALERIRAHSAAAYDLYLDLLNEDRGGEIKDPEKQGVARELARMTLPLNAYTEWYWKIDLHNLLHFTALRADSHAQYEIRAYAEVLMNVLQRWVPLAYGAFVNFRHEGTELSGKALAVVRRLLKGEKVDQAESGLSPREWRDLQTLLDLG
ncbi:MAG: FAD-dependent thymidylate synthase [Alphaproteobacteria bacterium]|nr:FAD-dependent thymidylate synthase [Alphaproteobacteria bacterium]